jgi:hypothetical protein
MQNEKKQATPRVDFSEKHRMESIWQGIAEIRTHRRSWKERYGLYLN